MYGARDSKPFLGPVPPFHERIYRKPARSRLIRIGANNQRDSSPVHGKGYGSHPLRIRGESQFVPIRPPPPPEVSLSRFLRREMRAFLPRNGKGWEGGGSLFSARSVSAVQIIWKKYDETILWQAFLHETEVTPPDPIHYPIKGPEHFCVSPLPQGSCCR